jgi:hypothetical protein
MANFSTLQVVKHSGSCPSLEGRLISGMRDGIPLGWLFLPQK